MNYPRYPEYKPSGVEWLGEVPAHWGLKRLKFASACINDKQDAFPEGLEYVAMEHIESWTGKRLETENGVTPESQTNRFSRGDVLFGKLRPYLAKAWLADRDGVCSTELLVLRERDLEPAYLRYWTLMRSFVEVVDGSTYGSKMPRASWDFIGNMPALIPARDEQRAIAAFLDRETARIDALIARKQRLIELLAEKRTALISQTVTKGLTNSPGANLNAGACDGGPKGERRDSASNPDAPTKDSGVEWLGEIPAHWDLRRLKDFGALLGGAGFPHEYQGVEGEELPFYKVGDLALAPDGKTLGLPPHSISRAVAAELRARVIPQGSVVYAKIGAALFLNRRRITSMPCCIDNNMTAYVTQSEDLSSEWAFYWLSILDFGKLANPGAVPSFSEGYQSALPLLVPPIQEQRTITAFLSHEARKQEALHNKVESAIEKLKEYRAALIADAVTGKIDVRSFAKQREVA